MIPVTKIGLRQAIRAKRALYNLLAEFEHGGAITIVVEQYPATISFCIVQYVRYSNKRGSTTIDLAAFFTSRQIRNGRREFQDAVIRSRR